MTGGPLDVTAEPDRQSQDHLRERGRPRIVEAPAQAVGFLRQGRGPIESALDVGELRGPRESLHADGGWHASGGLHGLGKALPDL